MSKDIQFCTVGVLAKRLGVPGERIAQLIYRNSVLNRECPLIGRIRMIPKSCEGFIVAELKRLDCRMEGHHANA